MVAVISCTATSGGTQITTSTKVNITANQTLYAQWQGKTYTVTFNANGGSVSTTTQTVTYGSTYGTLPTPSRTRYDFDGWFTSSSGGTHIYSSTTVSTASDHTLYAQWTIKYKECFCCGGNYYTCSCSSSECDTCGKCTNCCSGHTTTGGDTGSGGGTDTDTGGNSGVCSTCGGCGEVLCSGTISTTPNPNNPVGVGLFGCNDCGAAGNSSHNVTNYQCSSCPKSGSYCSARSPDMTHTKDCPDC